VKLPPAHAVTAIQLSFFFHTFHQFQYPLTTKIGSGIVVVLWRMLSMISCVKSVTELSLEKTMKRDIVEPATEFPTVVGIKVVFPPLCHPILPVISPNLMLK
jgi:hypothetical protein